MLDQLRRLLRRMGIGERRWIAEPDERHRHTELVRGRLPVDRGPDATEGGPGAAAPGESTDSVIS